MISFELFGQFVGVVDPSDDFFSHAVEQMADFAGLPAVARSGLRPSQATAAQARE